MKLRFLLAFTLASFAAAQVSVRGPELQMSGSTISHTKTDGNCHVPKSFNQPAGYQLTTNGGSCDLFWSAPGGAFVDSARVAHRADSAAFATRSDSARASRIADTAKRAGWADSSRVSGLSDSAKALIRYARTTAIHDTADTLRQRIKDSTAAVRAALPAYVRRIGDTITGPITGTTATAAPLINITTTFGNLANAAIRGTASASGGTAIHGVATGASGVGVWGVSSNTGGDGGLFSGTGGSNAIRAIATGGGKAGQFNGDVQVVGATTLASSLTGILKANAGLVSVADTSDFPTRPYLPLAAGSGSPLTANLYGTGLNFTTTADAPISIAHNLAGGFTHPFQAFNSGMVAGNQYNFDFGQSASTNNAGNFGFKYVGAGSSSNYVTLGMYGANDLLTVSGKAEARLAGSGPSLTFRNLSAGTNEKVWTWSNAGSALTLYAYDDAESVGSGAISISRTGATATNLLINPAQVDVTALNGGGIAKAAGGTGRLGIASAPDFPILNQSTTGNAATATKWATARTLTIGATGKAIDGTANQSWNLAEIGALAVGGTAVNSSALGGVNSDYFVQGNGTGALGHRTTKLTTSTIGVTQSGFFDTQTATDGPQGAVWTHVIRAQHSGGATTNDWSLDIAAPFGATEGGTEAYYVRLVSNGTTPGWRQLYHSGSTTITAGAAKIGTWAMAANHARFGHPSFDLAAGYGYLQNPDGNLYMDAPSGGSINLSVNGVSRWIADGAGNTLAGTTTLSALTGSTTRLATINAAGQIGAVDIGKSVESRVAPGSAVTVTHNTTVNITSISLPAGEWDVSGQATSINGGTGNFVTNFWTGATTTSATIPTDGTDGNSGYQTVEPNTQSTPAGTKRFVLGSTTTVYLVGKVLMSVGSGSVTAYGWISATRAK